MSSPANGTVDPPLDVTITDVTLAIGLNSYPHKLDKPLHAYIGDRIFCTATSDGTTLTIDFSQTGGDALEPGKPAKQATLSIAYDKAVAKDPSAPKPSKQTWTVPPDIGYDGTRLDCQMYVSSDRSTAHLIVSLYTPPLKDPHSKDADLGFVLVQQPGDDASRTFQVRWISIDAPDEILLKNYATFSRVSIIEPDPATTLGSIAGPLGILLG